MGSPSEPGKGSATVEARTDSSAERTHNIFHKKIISMIVMIAFSLVSFSSVFALDEGKADSSKKQSVQKPSPSPKPQKTPKPSPSLKP